jgi:hypothetical protein
MCIKNIGQLKSFKLQNTNQINISRELNTKLYSGIDLFKKNNNILKTINIEKNNLDLILTSALNEYKGSTRMGHSLSKHAGRNSEIWGHLKGSPSSWTNQAIKHFNDIYYGKGNFNLIKNEKNMIWIEKRLEDGRGIRLNRNFTFKGFID